MPNVNGQSFPYTKEGKMRAVAAAKAAGKPAAGAKENLPARVGETGNRVNMPARVGDRGTRQNLSSSASVSARAVPFSRPGQRQQSAMSQRPKQDKKY